LPFRATCNRTEVLLGDDHTGPDSSLVRSKNTYTLGRMGEHNVVIATLPLGEHQNTSARRVACEMPYSFPSTHHVHLHKTFVSESLLLVACCRYGFVTNGQGSWEPWKGAFAVHCRPLPSHFFRVFICWSVNISQSLEFCPD
jgi:hypothetical protein